MRKIINGRLYDTETAKMVGSDGRDLSDRLRYTISRLYRKRTGEHFLHEEGGAATRYAHQDELGGWVGGDVITPLPYDRAREWAEGHLDADAYEAEFGPVSEGAGDVPMSLRLPAETARRLREAAARRECTLAELVATLVDGME